MIANQIVTFDLELPHIVGQEVGVAELIGTQINSATTRCVDFHFRKVQVAKGFLAGHDLLAADLDLGGEGVRPV